MIFRKEYIFVGVLAGANFDSFDEFSRSLAMSFDGIAKLRFCPPTRVDTATPTTLPLRSKTGPPLLPCDIGSEI